MNAVACQALQCAIAGPVYEPLAPLTLLLGRLRDAECSLEFFPAPKAAHVFRHRVTSPRQDAEVIGCLGSAFDREVVFPIVTEIVDVDDFVACSCQHVARSALPVLGLGLSSTDPDPRYCQTAATVYTSRCSSPPSWDVAAAPHASGQSRRAEIVLLRRAPRAQSHAACTPAACSRRFPWSRRACRTCSLIA